MIIDAQHHYRISTSIPADMKSRLRWMNESGIDLAVLTNNTQVLTKNVQGKDDYRLSTWSMWNDELAEVEKQHPDRFVACPSIPIFDAKTAMSELERVVSSNETKAVIIQPFKWRIDHEYLTPFYEKLNDFRLPLFFHPVNNDLVVDKAVDDMRGVFGFAFNTTVALSCFMTSGLLDTYPRLKLVIPHLGGAFPFILGRLEIKYSTGDYKSSHPPSEYFGNFYFDVVAYSKKAVEFAASVFGPDRLVFGSDFGCPGENMVQPLLFKSYIEGLSIDHAEKQKILGGNLAGLLKIKVPSNEKEIEQAAATGQVTNLK